MTLPIRYQVSCLDTRSHYFEVEVHVPRTGPNALVFAMPAWTPGAYKIENFAGRVHGERFTDGQGRALSVRRLDKSSWEVTPAKGTDRTVIARYQAYGFDLGIHRSYLDDERAVINGASIFMYVHGRKEDPIEITFQMPKAWRQLDTGLDPHPPTPRRYRAKSYDQLIDSPVMMGNHLVETFTVNRRPHRVVLVGPGNYQIPQLLADMKKIVQAAANVFGQLPYEHYTFFCEMSPERFGGLEHCNSTHMIFPRWTFRPRRDYVLALSLIAHEYFHTWNVKRLRPAGLGPFDYTREVHSPLLWFAEGFTSYYDILLLCRAGCITPREYLDEVVRGIRRLNLTPGRLVQSLEESSRDTWIKLYHQTPDSPNTTISYYNKGSIFGLALDLTIRQATAGRHSLDDVMLKLYRSHFQQADRGLEPDDIRRAASTVAGRSLDRLFDRVVESTVDIDWNEFLAHAGVEMVDTDQPKGRRKSTTPERSYVGLRLGKGLVISQVLSDGPGLDAGLTAGDELIAIDGARLTEAKLDRMLGDLPIGQRIHLTLARAGVLQMRELTLGRRPGTNFVIQPRTRATPAQQKVYRAWIGKQWKELDKPTHGPDLAPAEKLI